MLCRNSNFLAGSALQSDVFQGVFDDQKLFANVGIISADAAAAFAVGRQN